MSIWLDEKVVAHNRPGVNTAGENLAQLQNAGFSPRLSMLETFAEVFVQATQPRSAHAAIAWGQQVGCGAGSWAQFARAGFP